MFREHIAIGAILSMIVVVGVYTYALVTDPLLLAILFVITIVGSFLPDVDSDSGMPFYLVFGTATLVATGVVLMYVLSFRPASDYELLGIPALALFFFWFIVGGIIKHTTHHRGIFHSIPALGVAAVGTLLIARYFGLDDNVAYIFAAAMGIGFASHLILDELHSEVSSNGIPFIPKKSLGTALKLFSDSNRVNIATYLLLAALAYTAFGKTPRAQALFYNDSDVIEIGAGKPPPANPIQNTGTNVNAVGTTGVGGLQSGDGTVSPSGSTGSGTTNSAGSGLIGSGSYDNTQSGVAPGGGALGSSNPNSALGVNGQNGSSSTTSNIHNGQQLFDYLLTQGVVSGSGLDQGTLGSGAGVGGSSLGAKNGGNGAFNVSISGSRVRATLDNAFSLQDVLQAWKAAKSGAYAPREYGLVAVSTALGDSNVQSVSFTASEFEIAYRSRGYLFSIIPFGFPARIVIVPEAPTASERVVVHLPWYSFFIRKFFTAGSLASEIDAAMQADIAKGIDPSVDMKAHLFDVVSKFLQQKIGTISDAIYLGTPSK